MAFPSGQKGVVGTLFEKNYHFGVGSLANSLYRSGYRGCLYAGYRGALPFWAKPLVDCLGGLEFRIAEDFSIRFIRISSDRHLTYCKPGFLIDILQHLEPDSGSAMYFDPDIVVKTSWQFFLDWVDGHIAVCEDINWRFSHNHPLRRKWAKFLELHGFTLSGKLDTYFNAGFVGVDRSRLGFLKSWETLLETIAPEVEHCVNITTKDRSYMFHKGDQDSMNMAAELFKESLSIIGPEGMDFVHGGYTMSHAVGELKPWEKKFFLSALGGIPPSQADKGFVANSTTPIAMYGDMQQALMKLDLLCGSAVGRLVRRT